MQEIQERYLLLSSSRTRSSSQPSYSYGWNPFSTSARLSTAAITITHACMRKCDCSNLENARVYSFIPVSQLPRDAPHKYDAFYELLIKEIEELFIKGKEVLYKAAAVPGRSRKDDFLTLHLMPLFMTADSKARHEI